MKKAISFDDVLLVPQYNEIASRKDPDTSIRISKNLILKIPVISSPMDTVTESAMAIIMWQCGGLGILHRYNSIAKQVEMAKRVLSVNANCAIAIGSTDDFLERAAQLIDNGANILCVDVAHGDSKIVIDAVNKLRKIYSHITIIAGNIATGEGCARLIDAGADAIRAGIGGGSVCSTRINTGHGFPTLQTIFDCVDYLTYRDYKDYCILADGGIKNSGDLVKSLAAGANAVILGQLLAATNEAPGELMEISGNQYKKYRGMSGYGAQAEWRPETRDLIVPEGEEIMLPYKGDVAKVLQQLIGGLRSGMTYSNARNIKILQEVAEFREITDAGFAESQPHAKNRGI